METSTGLRRFSRAHPFRPRNVRLPLSHGTVLSLVVSLLLVHPLGRLTAGEDKGNLNLVLIVDTSESMRGAGGAADIFGKVLRTCNEIAGELKPGDTVTLISFDEAPRTLPTVTLYGEAEKRRVTEAIHALAAEGNWTFTSMALAEGLEEAAYLEQNYPNHRQVVVVLTDGRNNPPPSKRDAGPTLREVTRPYAGKPWYVFQVQLGPEIDAELEDALRVFENAKTIHDHRAENVDDWRPTILPPAPPEKKRVVWRVEPKEIRLELEEQGVERSGACRIEFPAEVPSDAVWTRLDRGSVPPEIDLRLEDVSKAQGRIDLQILASARERIANDVREAKIEIGLADLESFAADPVEVPIHVKTRLVPPAWPKYLLAGFVLLLLAAGIILIAKRKRESRLFGSLDYWPVKGETGARRRVDDLAAYGGRAEIGTKQIVIPGVSSPLACLATRMENEERHVVVAPEKTVSIMHENREVVELVLYDSDEFEISGWCFRYRGAVSRRATRRS